MNKPGNIAIATLADIEHVVQRMRADEVEQYLAFTGHETFDPSWCALTFANYGPIRYVLYDDKGYPAVVAGWYHVYPGVLQCWMAATEDAWEHHWRSITKGCRWLIEELFKLPETRRLQMNALASRTEAIEWYEKSLLMQHTGTVEKYGANGEAAAFFAREVANG